MNRTPIVNQIHNLITYLKISEEIMNKDQFYKALSILCLLAFVLAACAPAATQTTAPVATQPAATEPAATEPAATEPAATQPAASEPVTLSLLGAQNQNDALMIKALTDAYMADSFKPTVSQNGGIFGVPVGFAASGGVLYNKKIYEQVGVSVPKTWAEFEANNEKIKAAGIPPVLQTYGDTWTAQLFVLADNYNVVQSNPNFAVDYTANKAKYATTPGAMEGFNHLQEGFQKGWYQKDFATTKFEQGLKMLADGEVAQYPMLTQVMPTIATNSPDKVNDIGFFALPGADASKNGATVWMPLAFYIPKTSKHADVAKDFFAFVASTAGTDAITAKVKPAGPYLIKGATLPDDVLPFVKDLNGYIDSGNAYPALEFLSPIKGPNLEQICVAVGTGQTDPATAA